MALISTSTHMSKRISIYIASRIILRGCYAEEGETHVVSEGELAELQATYPSAIVVEDQTPRDMTEPVFDPSNTGAPVIQDGAQNNDEIDADAGDDAEDDDDNQPGATGRKSNARRAGAKRPA